jgi:hypothetical protein
MANCNPQHKEVFKELVILAKGATEYQDQIGNLLVTLLKTAPGDSVVF